METVAISLADLARAFKVPLPTLATWRRRGVLPLQEAEGGGLGLTYRRLVNLLLLVSLSKAGEARGRALRRFWDMLEEAWKLLDEAAVELARAAEALRQAGRSEAVPAPRVWLHIDPGTRRGRCLMTLGTTPPAVPGDLIDLTAAEALYRRALEKPAEDLGLVDRLARLPAPERVQVPALQ
jgi:hypothetical protein